MSNSLKNQITAKNENEIVGYFFLFGLEISLKEGSACSTLAPILGILGYCLLLFSFKFVKRPAVKLEGDGWRDLRVDRSAKLF
jgi:hypothetical protein